ncbi:hypothetical protein BGZ49_001034 [Haplosporangium sp. Z 27]|nr:hypothetical protein BGZ49_001034 [Haplosporangium sp. Z 27]
MEHSSQIAEDNRELKVISSLSPVSSTPAHDSEQSALKVTSPTEPSAPSPPSAGHKKRLVLSPNRLFSLDLLRGLAIFIMITVNAQIGDNAFPILEHPDWIGFSIADTVFPSFLFITGCTIPLSIRVDANAPNHIYRSHAIRVFKRSFIIWALGVILNLYGLVQLHVGFDKFRWPNVLNRIGFCYLVVAWMHVLVLWKGRQPEKPLSFTHLFDSHGQANVGYESDSKGTSKDVLNEKEQNGRGAWPWFMRVTLPFYLPASCLLIWLICTYSVQVEGCPTKGMVYTPECSAQAYFDLKIFGKAHTYRHLAFDPEGSLSTLTSILNVWFGWFIGCTVRSFNAQVKQLRQDFKAHREKQGRGEEEGSLTEQILEQEMLTRIYTEHLSQWFWWGILWMFVGWIFSLGLPLSKPSWTATYAVLAAGVSQTMLSIFFYKFDAQPKIKELHQLHLEHQTYRSNNQLSRHYHRESSDPESLPSGESRSNYSSALNLYFEADHFCRHWFRKSIIVVFGSMGRNAILLYMCSELVQGTCSLIPGGSKDPTTGETIDLCTSAFNHTWGALNIGGWASLFYSLGFTALHVLLAIFLDYKKWYFKV